MSERILSRRLVLQGGLVIASGVLLRELIRRNRSSSNNKQVGEVSAVDPRVQENAVEDAAPKTSFETFSGSLPEISLKENFKLNQESSDRINQDAYIKAAEFLVNNSNFRVAMDEAGYAVGNLKRSNYATIGIGRNSISYLVPFEEENLRSFLSGNGVEWIAEIEIKSKNTNLSETFGLVFPPKLEVVVNGKSYSRSESLLLVTPEEEISLVPRFVPIKKYGETLIGADRFVGIQDVSTPFEKLRILQEKAKSYKDGDFYWPVSHEQISQYFGYGHEGVDLVAPFGYGIIASADGVVNDIRRLSYSYGWYLVLKHQNGFQSMYAHASDLMAELGQDVKRGDLIARVGVTGRSTGPHLHFEIHDNGKPVDPLKYLPS